MKNETLVSVMKLISEYHALANKCEKGSAIGKEALKNAAKLLKRLEKLQAVQV